MAVRAHPLIATLITPEAHSSYAMVDIDQYPCPDDDCEEAYPHPLLVEKHRVDSDDHEVPDADEIEGRVPR